jgi:hypothetical protein
VLGKYVKAVEYKRGDNFIYAYGTVEEEIKLNGFVTGYVIQTSKKKAIVRVGDIIKVADSHYDLIMGEVKQNAGHDFKST